MKPICLDLSEVNGLGDLICATPTIRKLAEAYETKIYVLSKIPELFKRNPHVEKSLKRSSVDMDYFNENFLIHNSFYNVGKKNERGIEYKHNRMDIRQYHAVHLGFMLTQTEMDCEYLPTEDCKHNLPDKYVVIHPVKTWESRTWAEEKWIKLIETLQEQGYHIVAIGKDSSETGFFNVDKPVFDLQHPKLINLLNKTSISDCWHIINNALCFITMDSGLLHLAGTTDTFIIHLGSSIHPDFRIPYRHGVQGYKVSYLQGSCQSFCASNMMHGVKEWGNIQGIPPLIKCLENRPTYECHPSVEQVVSKINALIL